MTRFEWDPFKEAANISKHGVDFTVAELAFSDEYRKIYIDNLHSGSEPRFFCYGKVGERILTVRFTYRGGNIRIIGAGFWRRGEKFYEEERP